MNVDISRLYSWILRPLIKTRYCSSATKGSTPIITRCFVLINKNASPTLIGLIFRCTVYLRVTYKSPSNYIWFTIKTTSFTPPSVIKLYLYVCIRFYMFRFLANHLQKAYQHCKGNYHYMIYKYIKLVPTDFFCTGQNVTFEATIKFLAFKMVSIIHSGLLAGWWLKF
jgi:hypothetical protein